jgi:hypothetical protein
LPRTPYLQTGNVQSGSTLSNRNAMTIFARLRSVHPAVAPCVHKISSGQVTDRALFSFVNAFHRRADMIRLGRVMTARFYPMKKVEVAAGNSRRMEARLSHWHNGGIRPSLQPPRWGGKARNVPRKIRALLRTVGSTPKCVGINVREQRPEIEITELRTKSLAGQS